METFYFYFWHSLRGTPTFINFRTKGCQSHHRPFHDNFGAVISACAQTLPEGNIVLTQNGNMHCVVYKCSNRQNSAAKENGIIFFIFPKDVKKRNSLINAVNRTDWSPHEIFSNFIMFGVLVGGWQCQ